MSKQTTRQKRGTRGETEDRHPIGIRQAHKINWRREEWGREALERLTSIYPDKGAEQWLYQIKKADDNNTNAARSYSPSATLQGTRRGGPNLDIEQINLLPP